MEMHQITHNNKDCLILFLATLPPLIASFYSQYKYMNMNPRWNMPFYRLFSLMVVWSLTASIPQAQNGSVVRLSDSIKEVSMISGNPQIPLISRSSLTSSEIETMATIEVVLKMRKFEELQARVGRSNSFPMRR